MTNMTDQSTHHAEAILRAAGSSLRHYEARTREAILAAVREAMGAQWLPIESAPKDGSRIIIAVTGGMYGAKVHEAYFCIDGEWGSDWWLAATQPSDYYIGPISDIMHGEISHWQPLPTPPRGAKPSRQAL